MVQWVLMMVCSEAATAYGYGSGDAATDSTTRFGSLPDAAVRPYNSMGGVQTRLSGSVLFPRGKLSHLTYLS